MVKVCIASVPGLETGNQALQRPSIVFLCCYSVKRLSFFRYILYSVYRNTTFGIGMDAKGQYLFKEDTDYE